MKAILQPTTKIFALAFAAFFAVQALPSVPSSARASEPLESGAGKVCGILRSFEGETQVFDYTRTHLGDAAYGTKLHCGDWISVEKGKATVEHSAGAAILVAENTFFQILDPQSGANPEHAHLALYRGEFLAQPEKVEIRVVTPNAVGRIEKGGAFVVYSTVSDETQIVGLGGKTSLENRYFPEPRMEAGFGKVVTFANPVERLIPDQARFVSSRDLGERLARLGVPKSVLDQIEKTVKAGVKTKMPVSLALTAKTPRAIIKVQASGEFATHDTISRAGRSPASVGHPVVAPKPVRVATKRSTRDEPNFALKREGHEESEKKKLLQALSSMRPEEEE